MEYILQQNWMKEAYWKLWKNPILSFLEKNEFQEG